MFIPREEQLSLVERVWFLFLKQCSYFGINTEPSCHNLIDSALMKIVEPHAPAVQVHVIGLITHLIIGV